jgi:hypothetical protein
MHAKLHLCSEIRHMYAILYLRHYTSLFLLFETFVLKKIVSMSKQFGQI